MFDEFQKSFTERDYFDQEETLFGDGFEPILIAWYNVENKDLRVSTPPFDDGVILTTESIVAVLKASLEEFENKLSSQKSDKDSEESDSESPKS